MAAEHRIDDLPELSQSGPVSSKEEKRKFSVARLQPFHIPTHKVIIGPIIARAFLQFEIDCESREKAVRVDVVGADSQRFRFQL